MVWPIFRFIQYFWLPGFNDQVNTEHLIYIRHSLDANISYNGLGSLFSQILGHLKITKK